MSSSYEYSVDELSVAGPWTSSAPIDSLTYNDTRDYDNLRCKVVPGVSLDNIVQEAQTIGHSTLTNYSPMLRALAARAKHA